MSGKNFNLPKAQLDLTRSRDIGAVCEYLEGLPLDQSWKVEISERKSERSLQQNKYLFGVSYELISLETGYEKDDLHTSLLCKHFGKKLKRVPKSKYNSSGLIEVPLRTTTTDEHGRRSVLGKVAFSEYVAFVQRFASQHLGIVIPDPDPDHIEAEREAA
jgi:hypothetical protein